MASNQYNITDLDEAYQIKARMLEATLRPKKRADLFKAILNTVIRHEPELKKELDYIRRQSA